MEDTQTATKGKVLASETAVPTVRSLGKELGRSGTSIIGGRVVSEEYNRNLVGKELIKKVEIMRRSDATVRATLQIVKLPLLALQWDIEPASQEQADLDHAELVKHDLFKNKVNWHHFLREATNFFDFGHSVGEKTYYVGEFNKKPAILTESVHFRKQNSIDKWETEDEKPGITQLLVAPKKGDPTRISIPMTKLIVFTHDMEGENIEGISLLRYAYKHWDIKDKLDILNAVASEQLAMGVPVLKKPAAPNPGDIELAREAIRQFRANEERYVELPEGWDLIMLDMKGQTIKDLVPSIQYHDRQITKSVLAQFLELGASNASGSRAVSTDHSKLFMLSEDAAAKTIQATIQEQWIKQLCDLNFSDMPNGYPKLVYGRVNDDDLTILAEAVAKLIGSNAITPDPDLEQHLRQTLHLPELPQEIRDGYEERRKAREEEAARLKKEAEKDPPKDKPKKDVQASIRRSRQVRNELLDVLVG